MPSANPTRLGLGIFLFGVGISLLTTGGVGLFTLRLARRVTGEEPIVILAVVSGFLLLALGSAMVAHSLKQGSASLGPA